LFTKIPGHKELRNTENEEGHSERGKKPIYAVVSKVVHPVSDEGQAKYYKEDYPVVANKVYWGS